MRPAVALFDLSFLPEARHQPCVLLWRNLFCTRTPPRPCGVLVPVGPGCHPRAGGDGRAARRAAAGAPAPKTRYPGRPAKRPRNEV